MYNEEMYALGSKRSAIREIFEYAKTRSEQIGAENVFDFSIGNPSIPAPKAVAESIELHLKDTNGVVLHGYTSAQGDKGVRDTIAKNYESRFEVPLSGEDIYMTCGAAASLTITLRAIARSGDEVIAIAPYFPEYRVFVEGAGMRFTSVPSDPETMFPDFNALKGAINPQTKAVIINSPNNPSGVVYGADVLAKLAEILRAKSKEYGAPVYLISDEPYRELIYDGQKAESPFRYYEETFVCYSYSKSLSLAGERIGYIAVSPTMTDSKTLYACICGAGRALGYVCAPALFQRVIADCDGMTADIGVYKRNRDILYRALTEYGFTCVYPSGAFYLFMKAEGESAQAFCDKAREYELLLVAGDGFGASGWVRIAYCVETERILRALPKFESLAKELKNIKKF